MIFQKPLDHIKPLCIGGLHMKDNVRYVHGICNKRRPRDGSDILFGSEKLICQYS